MWTCGLGIGNIHQLSPLKMGAIPFTKDRYYFWMPFIRNIRASYGEASGQFAFKITTDTSSVCNISIQPQGFTKILYYLEFRAWLSNWLVALLPTSTSHFCQLTSIYTWNVRSEKGSGFDIARNRDHLQIASLKWHTSAAIANQTVW